MSEPTGWRGGLRELGVGPETSVVVDLVERSIEMVVGFAGCAEGRRGLCAAGSRLHPRTTEVHGGR